MSAWDEKAEDYAVAHHTYEYLTPDENAYYTSGFARGARWQRAALLSDETVMRVAQAIYESAPNRWTWTWEQIVDGWKNKPYPDYPHLVDDMRRQAMAALTAAIGDDDE